MSESFEDIADMSISAVGGVSNQRGKAIAQRQDSVRKSGGSNAKEKTKLAVRKTYVQRTKPKEANLFKHLPGELQQILDQFMNLFESDPSGVNQW